MAYVNQVQPINFMGNFLQGRQIAQDEQTQGIRNALASQQLGQVTRQNALYANPGATPEQFIRAGDTQTGQALQGVQDKAQSDKVQAVQQLAAVAQRALSLDPQSRKQFLTQAAQVYAPAFRAMGADPVSGTAQLESLPDDELVNRLQQVAKFAAPQTPIKLGPGEQLLNPNTYQPVAGTAGEVVYKDAGDKLVPVDKVTGVVRPDLPPIRKAAAPINMNTKEVPSGYEWDPSTPGALRPVPGGPHDPNAVSSGMDSRSAVMFNRVASSAQSALKSIQNITQLPITTSSGWFGTAEPGHSLMSSVKSVLGQKVTSQEAQDYKTMVAGVARNLSTIETAGLAPNGAITNSMNSVLLNEGDTQMTKLRKLAEMRQIVEEGLKPQLANPKLAPTQKQLIQNIITGVQQAVPFTHSDITALQRSKNPQATVMDFATQTGLPTTQNASDSPVRVNSIADALKLQPGTVFITPDGRQKVR